jgi:AraC-like DNA-binding protein
MGYTDIASLQTVIWNLIEHYGIDPEKLFREAHLDPSLVKIPGKRYSSEKLEKLWELMSATIDDPCYGLKAVQFWHPSNTGALGYAMLASKTLRESIDRLVRYHKVVSTDEFVKIEEDENCLKLIATGKESRRQNAARNDAALSVILSVLRLNYQKDLAPIEVSLTHSMPSCSSEYYKVFQCPIVFDASCNSLSLAIDVLDEELKGANDQLAEFNDRVIVDYIASLEQNQIITRVKEIILDHLPSGNVLEEEVAKKLFMSKRTMQRTLQKEGTSFIELLNGTRLDLSKQYVRNKEISFTEIAFLLGFTESSTFSRAFKRWTGKTPSQYRKVV